MDDQDYILEVRNNVATSDKHFDQQQKLLLYCILVILENWLQPWHTKIVAPIVRTMVPPPILLLLWLSGFLAFWLSVFGSVGIGSVA